MVRTIIISAEEEEGGKLFKDKFRSVVIFIEVISE